MLRNLAGLTLITLMLVAMASEPVCAFATDWRLGVSTGLGSSSVTVKEVSNSESPLVFKLWGEFPLSFDKTLILEHTRSLKPSPFASGIAFSGATALWFPWGCFPQRLVSGNEAVRNAWTQKRIAPFLGLGTGLGSADSLKKVGAQSLMISGYSFYLSMRVGADYPISSALALRSQLELNTSAIGTSMGSTAFHLGALWYL